MKIKMIEPWRTDCTDCGACCEYMLLPLRDEDHAKWAKYHGVEVVTYGSSLYVKINTPCKYLNEDKSCGVHGTDLKPKMCSEFMCAALVRGGVDIESIKPHVDPDDEEPQ